MNKCAFLVPASLLLNVANLPAAIDSHLPHVFIHCDLKLSSCTAFRSELHRVRG